MASSIVDLFKAETEIEIKASELFALMREATRAEMMMNAVKCEIPYKHILETMTGEKILIIPSQEENHIREYIEKEKEQQKKIGVQP